MNRLVQTVHFNNNTFLLTKLCIYTDSIGFLCLMVFFFFFTILLLDTVVKSMFRERFQAFCESVPSQKESLQYNASCANGKDGTNTKTEPTSLKP